MKIRNSDTGDFQINLIALTVSFLLIVTLGLFGFLLYKGTSHFLVKPIISFDSSPKSCTDPQAPLQKYWGIEYEATQRPTQQADGQIALISQRMVRLGNRNSFAQEFMWFCDNSIHNEEYPKDLAFFETLNQSIVIGNPEILVTPEDVLTSEESDFSQKLAENFAKLAVIREDILEIQTNKFGKINSQMQKINIDRRQSQIDGTYTPDLENLFAQRQQTLELAYIGLEKTLQELVQKADNHDLLVRLADGEVAKIQLLELLSYHFPNNLHVWEKLWQGWKNFYSFLANYPRQGNTEGGVYPAIIGTILMVFIMTLVVTPLGVLVAVYLHEYAGTGWFVSLIRICVNNLAGVPSVVFGIFGLGFFVYIIGSSIDAHYYQASLPNPTFGTPGLLWASLTLAILTIPVVIVATEEGLSRIPKIFREGSYALGATKAETLWKIILPMTVPSMITGMILAITRAAGEVAPIMLVGVVKSSPTLPLTDSFPFIQFEQKIMHLGFHIFDTSFQSPNIEATKPIVFATTLLLMGIIILLSSISIWLRQRLRDKYKSAY